MAQSIFKDCIVFEFIDMLKSQSTIVSGMLAEDTRSRVRDKELIVQQAV